MMSVVQELLSEYTRMRENGLEAKAALHALRPYIEPMPDNFKAELAKYLRQWERGELSIHNDPTTPSDEITRQDMAPISDAPPPVPTPPSSDTKTNIKRIKPASPIRPIARQTQRPGEDLMPAGLKPGATWISCPNCNTKNKANEIFCYACGHLIDSGQGFNSTRSFADATTESFSPEFFGKDSLLILRMRESGAFFKLRPQNYTHELVIGRSSSNTAMTPDIDLTQENADEYGVSRLHLAIQYIMENSTLMVFDLGSANGSFINGQKLHPSEKRILRNGDELRLGHLVIRAEYEHPGPEVE